MSEATNPVAMVRAACGCPGHRPTRRAARSDAPRLRPGALHRGPPRTEDAYASFIGRQIGESSVVLLVAERDGKVLGYTYAGVERPDYMSLRGPAGVLYDIVVDPNHRGHGVGRLLLEAILAALKARGAPRVVVSTAERNEAAQRLLARAGFRPTMIEMTRELHGHES